MENKLTPPVGPYSHFQTDGHLVITSGQVAITPEGACLTESSIEEQTRVSMENLAAVLEAAGSSLRKALKITIHMTDLQDFDKMNAVYRSFFPEGRYPARLCVEVSNLYGGFQIEIDAIATV